MSRQKKLSTARKWRSLNGSELAAGKWIAAWLNIGMERNGDKTRVIALIDLLKRLQIALEQVRGLLRWQWPNQVERDVRELEDQLRKRTMRYVSYPDYRAEHDGSSRIAVARPHINEGLKAIGESRRAHNGVSIEEGQATDNLPLLVRGGSLERLALCANCHKGWLFRIRKTDRYCSRKCRQQPYEAKPRRKQQKRRNSSQRYRLIKRLNERAQKRAELELKQAREPKQANRRAKGRS